MINKYDNITLYNKIINLLLINVYNSCKIYLFHYTIKLKGVLKEMIYLCRYEYNFII